MSLKTHWEKVYSSKAPEQVGWYEPHLQTSLAMINRPNVSRDAKIIDVGGGASTLVDDLLHSGFKNITVIDVALSALEQARLRLGERAALVRWLDEDVTRVALPANYYDIRHDRAVFHFLTEIEPRKRYVSQLWRALKPGGHLMIATFAAEAPPKCSGLNVFRYSVEQMQSELGTDWILHEHQKELHLTPGGVEQMYLYCRSCASSSAHVIFVYGSA